MSDNNDGRDGSFNGMTEGDKAATVFALIIAVFAVGLGLWHSGWMNPLINYFK